MAKDNELMDAISRSRKVSEDGSIVTYDLTEGVDFSNPKKAAEALAAVFFESDAQGWFKVTGDHIDFDPTSKVRIIMAEDHNRKLEETVDDFLKDLQQSELHPKFSKQIDDTAEKASKVQAAMIGGSLKSLIFRHFEKEDYDYLIQDDLFLDVLEKLEIRSLNDKDLMDWKNLPL